VYHYLAYEKKIGEYGEKLDSANLNESQRSFLKSRLMEAKEKMKELKKTQAERVKEKKMSEGILSGGERPCTECGGTGMVYEEPAAIPDHVKSKVRAHNSKIKGLHAGIKRLQAEEEMDEEFQPGAKEGDSYKTKRGGTVTKTKTGLKHEKGDYNDDEDYQSPPSPPKSHAKARSAAEKSGEKAADKAQANQEKALEKKGVKITKVVGGKKVDPNAPKKKEEDDDLDETFGQGVYEAAKPDYIDLDKDGNKKETMKKAAADKKKSIKENMSSADLAHHHACEYAKHHKSGNIDLMKHHKDECQKHGGAISHGSMGECYHQHAGLNGGAMYECGMIMEGRKTMSRAAKGMMKYGKDGMKALAKAGKEGKDLDKVRDKYNKYDEGARPATSSRHDKLVRAISSRMSDKPYEPTDAEKEKADRSQREAGVGKYYKSQVKKVDEDKPSAGLSKSEKSAVVKKAKSGEDIGKSGKGFAKLAKKAGGGEKGEKIAAAAMWKNIKETTAYMAEKKAVEKQADKDYDGDGKIESGKDEYMGSRDKAIKAAMAKKETVKESTEINRLKALTQRLLG
jgi:hypothetical protein